MSPAQTIFNRLSTVEKLALRAATTAGVEYLADSAYRVDMVNIPPDERVDTLLETQAMCSLEYSVRSDTNWF